MKSFKTITLLISFLFAFTLMSTDGNDTGETGRDGSTVQSCHTEYHLVWGVGGQIGPMVIAVEVCN